MAITIWENTINLQFLLHYKSGMFQFNDTIKEKTRTKEIVTKRTHEIEESVSRYLSANGSDRGRSLRVPQRNRECAHKLETGERQESIVGIEKGKNIKENNANLGMIWV